LQQQPGECYMHLLVPAADTWCDCRFAGCELCWVDELQVFPAVFDLYLCGHQRGYCLPDTAHADILLWEPRGQVSLVSLMVLLPAYACSNMLCAAALASAPVHAAEAAFGLLVICPNPG
jgi:hypothetical protein